MSKLIRYTPIRSGIRALLKRPETQDVLLTYGQAVMRQVGAGYALDRYPGRVRSNVMVAPKTAKAKRDNLEHNTLLKIVRGMER